MVFAKTVVVSEAQSRLDALNPTLPEHLSISIPSVQQLYALRAGVAKLAERSAQKKSRAAEAARKEKERAALKSRAVAETEPDGGGRGRGRKRAHGGFVLQISVPRKARRRVIDAISEAPRTKRVHEEARRARGSRSRTGSSSPGSSRTRAGPPDKARPVGPERAGLDRTETGMSEGDVDRMRQQSARLEALMRAFKHGGDATREAGGRVEEEVGYYLESLACCLEDFWSRRVWEAASEVGKKWETMVGFCNFVFKRSGSAELAPQRGCAALIAASVHYQLASVALGAVRRATDDAGAAARAARAAAQHVADMEQAARSGSGLVDAHCLARSFPQTWRRCQESAVNLGAFELRSRPQARAWPPVQYPVGPTSNPLDVANFVRQVGHECLERRGLSLSVQGT
ncbi:hypothetical protein GGF46_003424 [Coemansia sp. RSA 552]|nr:hypothetical protein GGF46_003424 [Coemansia sp. RSA 552]